MLCVYTSYNRTHIENAYIYQHRASGREQRSSGGNTSSNPQVSAPVPRLFKLSYLIIPWNNSRCDYLMLYDACIQYQWDSIARCVGVVLQSRSILYNRIITPKTSVWDPLYNVRQALPELFRYITGWLPISVYGRHRTTWNKHSRRYLTVILCVINVTVFCDPRGTFCNCR